MDKLFGMLGMVIVAAVIKVRTAAEGVIEMIRGDDGFLMMIGICGVVLLGAIVMLSWTSRKRREAA
ncbi:MAG: hypothetical protein IKK48_03295 [Firmicutes bacterium]|nr:hypothetical protein [Bacillota bacterium]